MSAPVTTSRRQLLATELLPDAEQLVHEFGGRLTADIVVQCLEAAMSGALLLGLEGADAAAATVRAAREDCLALLEVHEESALAS